MMQRYGKEIRAASSVTVKLYSFMHELQERYECDTDDEATTGKTDDEYTMAYTLEPDSESYSNNTP